MCWHFTLLSFPTLKLCYPAYPNSSNSVSYTSNQSYPTQSSPKNSFTDSFTFTQKTPKSSVTLHLLSKFYSGISSNIQLEMACTQSKTKALMHIVNTRQQLKRRQTDILIDMESSSDILLFDEE